MGTDGLKRHLRWLARRRNLYTGFQDIRILVDASIWLYKRVARGEYELIVVAFWRRLQRILAAEALPVVVFDGDSLQARPPGTRGKLPRLPAKQPLRPALIGRAGY